MKAYHLVVDSCGFLKNSNIRELGDKIYTCPDVVAEVKDRQTRRLLAVLPFELILKEPSIESIRKISEVSKVTGDYRSLSHTDIQVLALTYELSKLHGVSDIIDDVTKKTDMIEKGGSFKGDLTIPGFYMPPQDEKVCSDVMEDEEDAVEDEKDAVLEQLEEINLAAAVSDVICDDEINQKENPTGDGWITPALLREMKLKVLDGGRDSLQVGCLTTDFAMQNVMKKMNLNIISVDGMLVTSLRTYVLRCHACFEVTKILTKTFCPKCGNKTLKRVPVQLNDDGTMKMFFSRNPKVLNPRGLHHSLPKPQGGKHANNPMLVEDQRTAQNRPSKKALQKTNVFSDGYEDSASPFALNDTESRAFRLGIRPGKRRGNGGGRFIRRR